MRGAGGGGCGAQKVHEGLGGNKDGKKSQRRYSRIVECRDMKFGFCPVGTEGLLKILK